MVSTATLAKIHIAKKQLAMEDEDYRAMLRSIGGVESAKDLSPIGAAKVMSHLERCGFKPLRQVGRRPRPTRDKNALVGKIEALLAEAERPWSYADAMAKRMFGIEKIDWCDVDQLWRIAAALQKDAKRHGRA
ncbi:regulatory protein GemA [Cupriavidus gilardii]|uniref:Regulatory protein GemA n=1 Tax=Cupriavidus gilardii TaxID=82541 RepID=A0ABY4VRW8_9BURK|nr:regulatory protein GemA [Cupriavidus gilardii]USE78083.1 regulatory protein GemA [Cupriavidus gilardii]